MVEQVVNSPALHLMCGDENNGRFRKGEHRSPGTEFKKGQHWRPRKPHWHRDWLVTEYLAKQRSTGDIAREVGCTDANILFWLKKHGIVRRSVSQARGGGQALGLIG